jgi:hypothetical protein
MLQFASDIDRLPSNPSAKGGWHDRGRGDGNQMQLLIEFRP